MNEREHISPDDQEFCPHGNEPTGCERCIELHRRWEEIAADVEEIVDRLGKPIDPGIKEAVIALQAHQISTAGSWEGHVGRGGSYPWVHVQSPASERIQSTPRYQELKVAGRTERQGGPALSEAEKAEYHELLVRQADADLRTRQEIEQLLEEFYAGATDEDQPNRIAFVPKLAHMRLAPQYAEQYRERTNGVAPEELKRITEEYTERLPAGQAEMQRFAEFLKQKYFGK